MANSNSHSEISSQETIIAALGDLARNPRNPVGRFDQTALEGLVTSVRQVGVIEPLAVASRAVWLAAFPDDEPAIDGRPYVVLAGHRRLAAAMQAGLHDVPIVVRDDLAGRLDELVLHENLHRLDLTPLDEAHAYQRLANQGLSHRQIATHVGVSQGQVSKRLSLLKLPPHAQDALVQGRIDIATALEWAHAPRPVTAEIELIVGEYLTKAATTTWEWQSVLRQAQRHVAAARALDAAREVASAEEIPLVEDPDVTFKHRAYLHELRRPAEIAKARADGLLVVSPGWGGPDDPPRYFSTQPQADATGEGSAAEAVERRERAKAVKSREEALVTLAQEKIGASEYRAILTTSVLYGLRVDSYATKIAMKVATAAGIGPTDADDYIDWLRAARKNTTHREQLALLLVLAAAEEAARSPYVAVGQEDLWYYRILTDHTGYTPTPWEAKRIRQAKEK